MVCVGIDVAKDKHDCCILDSDGMVRADCFTIPNNMDGFKQLLQTIRNCTKKSDKIKVGLEPSEPFKQGQPAVHLRGLPAVRHAGEQPDMGTRRRLSPRD